MMNWRGVAAAIAILGILTSSTPMASAHSGNAVGDRVVLVVDSSGTMGKKDVYPTRMAAARSAARSLVNQTASGHLGLMTYGTSTGNSGGDKAQGCQDVTSVVPVAAMTDGQRSQLLSGINGLRPRGYTPIGLALQKGVAAIGNAGTVVLISDGEDTCAPPDPCEIAAQLKSQHPDVTISTVGFRTDESAREQLSCIAGATGGVFVAADDLSQLTRRLAAAASGGAVLTTTGYQGIELGSTLTDIRKAHKDFPAQSQAEKYNGSLPGKTVIRYRDCDYVFAADGTLVGLEQVKPGRTVDGVAAGDTVGKAVAVYGKPWFSTKNKDGTYTVRFRADIVSDSSYQAQLSGPPTDESSFIRTIVLCRCAMSSDQVLSIQAKDIGGVSTDGPYKQIKTALISRFGEPDSIRDFTCELAHFNVGEVIGWGDFYIAGWGASDPLEFAGWEVAGTDTPVPMTLPYGLGVGASKADALSRKGAIDSEDWDSVWLPGEGDENGFFLGYDGDRIVSVSTMPGCD